jgi:hypothetical protein
VEAEVNQRQVWVTHESNDGAGPVLVEELGFTLPHEHVMLTIKMFFYRGARRVEDRARRSACQPGEHRRASARPDGVPRHPVLNDEEVAVKELAMFGEAAGYPAVLVPGSDMLTFPGASCGTWRSA